MNLKKPSDNGGATQTQQRGTLTVTPWFYKGRTQTFQRKTEIRVRTYYLGNSIGMRRDLIEEQHIVRGGENEGGRFDELIELRKSDDSANSESILLMTLGAK
jgi:hypothetical protein